MIFAEFLACRFQSISISLLSALELHIANKEKLIKLISNEIWKKMGEPELLATALKFQSTSKHPLPILSKLVAQSRLKPHSGKYIP